MTPCIFSYRTDTHPREAYATPHKRGASMCNEKLSKFCPLLQCDCLRGKCMYATYDEDGCFMLCAVTLQAEALNRILGRLK